MWLDLHAGMPSAGLGSIVSLSMLLRASHMQQSLRDAPYALASQTLWILHLYTAQRGTAAVSCTVLRQRPECS